MALHPETCPLDVTWHAQKRVNLETHQQADPSECSAQAAQAVHLGPADWSEEDPLAE
jgi:hypothetical protein